MTEIERPTRLWTVLTDTLDYHDKKWHICNEGDWEELPFSRLHDALFDLGVGHEPQFGVTDLEREEVIKQFHYRDEKAHARPYADLKRAQKRLKL